MRSSGVTGLKHSTKEEMNCTLYKVFYKQNCYGNVTCNGFAQSFLKLIKETFKVAALKLKPALFLELLLQTLPQSGR